MTRSVSPDEQQDPRVVRTRTHVLSHARGRAVSGCGPNQVIYQELASRARLTRQTLYRHWPTREALFADVAMESAAWVPTSSGSAVDVIRDFLHTVREGMDEPRNAGPLPALVALADHGPTCQKALTRVVTERRNELNRALALSGCPTRHRGVRLPARVERLERQGPQPAVALALRRPDPPNQQTESTYEQEKP